MLALACENRSMPKQPDPNQINRLRHIALGSELAGEVLVPVLLGLWADRHFDRSPTYVLIGTFVALAAVGVTLTRIVKGRSN
ncbi:MAG: AtpZ/AtpI family protein [Planctomycetota bacterium]